MAIIRAIIRVMRVMRVKVIKDVTVAVGLAHTGFS